KVEEKSTYMLCSCICISTVTTIDAAGSATDWKLLRDFLSHETLPTLSEVNVETLSPLTSSRNHYLRFAFSSTNHSPTNHQPPFLPLILFAKPVRHPPAFIR
ncbi:hypothetical protein CBL_21179, partial [Carabus blaptoides fortunei]